MTITRSRGWCGLRREVTYWRRALTKIRNEQDRRWMVATILGYSNRTCWSSVVDYTLDTDRDDRREAVRRLLDQASCIESANRPGCGACYCGKVRNPAIWEQTRSDAERHLAEHRAQPGNQPTSAYTDPWAEEGAQQ